MRISDWSSDVCSSDLGGLSGEGVEQGLALLVAQATDATGVGDADLLHRAPGLHLADTGKGLDHGEDLHLADVIVAGRLVEELSQGQRTHLELLLDLSARSASLGRLGQGLLALLGGERSEEHTSELQSLMRISYAVFCL